MRVTKLPAALTATEKQIFGFLLQVNKRYDLGVTLRVAGGWVRDRLLGDVSDDIDIALEGEIKAEPVTGATYAEYITQYQTELGLEHHRVGVIERNPDQSKHLETATTHLFGMSVDFVNLRCEEYADSRIPEIRPGTPLEDAQRRDLTINALFYNLHTENVEDFTTGLEDMEKKLVRTPLCPSVTFHDDPLRLLRCVRFACRFGCDIHSDITESARQPTVHDALRDKVSRERVGIEVRKMLLGPDPARCFDCFRQFHVEECIFELCKCDKKGVISKIESVQYTPEEWQKGVYQVRVCHEIASRAVAEGDEPTLQKARGAETYLAAMLLSLGSLPETFSNLEKFLSGLVTHGLKLPKKTHEIMIAIIMGVRRALPLFSDAADEEVFYKGFTSRLPFTSESAGALQQTPRVRLCETMHTAKIFADTGKKGQPAEPVFYWKEALVLAELVACGKAHLSLGLCKRLASPEGEWKVLRDSEARKPPLRGNDLASALKLKGPAIRMALSVQDRFLAEFPEAKADEARAYVQRVMSDANVLKEFDL